MGPFGIQQFDAGAALNVYQGAQDRRVNQMLMQRKIALEDRQLEREERISNIYKNIHAPGAPTKGGDPVSPTGGLAAAYAPPPTSMPVTTPTGSPLSPATAPPAPQAAPQGPVAPQAPAQPPAGWYEANKDAVDQLMTVAPQQAFQLMTQLQGLDKAGLAKVQATAETFAKVGEHLHSFPEGPARQAELQRITPDLVAEGIPADAIARADVSDKGLQWLIVHGSDLDKVVAREKDERDYAETVRSHRANEANAAANVGIGRGNLAVRQGALGLARSKEGRVASKSAGGGDVSGLSTADLIRMAGGE